MSSVHKHVKSRSRVVQFGEVLTPPEIVNAMLDLVKQETERIDSRFLEPACGTGNFLTEILRRKIHVVEKRYKKIQLEYKRYAVLAISSIYGIDILKDNVLECRDNLFGIVDRAYTRLYRRNAREAFRESVRYILSRNIIHGDALNLETVGENPQPIVFSEWSLFNGSLLKRRDFSFKQLVSHSSSRDVPLFSDAGDDAFIAKPVRDYPLTHFLEVARAYPE